MNDEQAHFATLIGDLCEDARVGNLPIEVLTDSGERIVGVPEPLRPAGPRDQLDHTGWSRHLRVGEETVALETIAELRIARP